MAHLTFSGPPATGFGGPRSTPTQFDGAFGALESTPHNPVHPQTGGAQVDPCLGGLMTDPRCAALDPIFWLHHANIDRLWNRWIDLGGGRANPADAAWLGQAFQFHDPAGTAISLRCSEVVDTVNQLQYKYDDQVAPVSPPLSPVPTPPQPPQMGGASTFPLQLVGETASVPISVPDDLIGQLNDLLAGVPSIQLTVEDIVGSIDPGLVYEVFLDVVPAVGGEPTHNLVGNITFFGLAMQGDDSGVHAEPPGLRHTFDITPIVETLASQDLWDAGGLSVSFAPVGSGLPDGVQSLVDPVPVEPIEIGRVSLFIG
jgi:tyrosinase